MTRDESRDAMLLVGRQITTVWDQLNHINFDEINARTPLKALSASLHGSSSTEWDSRERMACSLAHYQCDGTV